MRSSRSHHQLDPEESQIGDLRRRRTLSRHHRARRSQNRRRQPGDPGHARRSQAVAGDSLSRRLHRDRRAQLPHVGATLIGILAVTLIGLPLGLAEFTGIVSAPPSLAPTFLQLDFSRVAELTFIIIVFSFLMVDVFDNAGTLIEWEDITEYA